MGYIEIVKLFQTRKRNGNRVKSGKIRFYLSHLIASLSARREVKHLEAFAA